MKVISKTDWARTHADGKKFENGQHFIQGTDLKFIDGKVNTFWIPVKIKGVKKSERY